MQKKFTIQLVLFMMLGMILMVGIIFLIQTNVGEKTQMEDGYAHVETLKKKLEANNIEAENLTETLGANGIAKARAFAYMIKMDPEIIKDFSKMEEIAKLLDVDEVHVTDGDGILWWGNIKSYYGFDFASSDQTKPFLAILDDPSLEIAQDPQPNGTTGELFQYISVARMDGPGVVQIGNSPHVLEDMLKNNTISHVIKEYDIGGAGSAFAISKTDQTILGHQNEALIGKTMTEAGFPSDLMSDLTKVRTDVIDGTSMRYVTQEYEDMILGIAVPVSEVYAQRESQTKVFFVCCLIIFLVLIFIINAMLYINVVSGIQEIIRGLREITKGNLTTIINVRKNKEFNILSNSINEMVGSIKEGFDKNQVQLLENQRILEKQQQLFMEMKNISGSIAQSSMKTLDISQVINQGSTQQADEVDALMETMNMLSEDAKKNAQVSLNTLEISNASMEQMGKANQDMQEMKKAMDDIAAASEKIEHMIKTIDNIADQTNILSLNAAVEAVRAGEAGKGFAIVAEQVRTLAAQSAKAASESGELIQNSLKAIEKGGLVAERAAREFEEIMIHNRNSQTAVEQLSDSSNKQAEAVAVANSGIKRISDVVEKNAQAARESQNASEELAGQAQRLKEIIA